MAIKKQLLRITAAALTILFIVIGGATAQDIGSIDFPNLRSSDLSDQQIERLWQRAQSQGYSVSDIEQLALSRGMQPSQVSALVRRLRDIRMSSGDSSRGSSEGEQLRQMNMPTVSQPDTVRREQPDSRIFGANLFRSEQITFTPSLNIPTPENYQLGPGDELIIDIWGAAEQTYRKTISPEGTISIANLGPMYLNGLSIERARDRVRSSLSRIYSGLKAEGDAPTDTQARISLGNIRSISVTVLGEAQSPGTYTLPSLATAFNALYSAGGPSDSGTFRSIEIIRNDTIAATLDIYDFLVYGNQEDNIRLRDQDIIKIDPNISRVELSGNTKRTGLFELKEDETMQDLITYAGGFSDNAYTKRIKVLSNTESQKRIDDIAYPEQRDFVLNDGSQVTVGEVLDRYENRVQIEGAVFRPGGYELNDTTTVYSLIQRAEGLREDVFRNRGLILREQDDLTTKTIPFNIGDIMTNPEQNDIQLERNDVVQISSIFDLREEYEVNIVGAVQDPGSFSYAENMSLEDLILRADGFRESAAPYRIEVSRRITGGDSTYVPKEMAEIFRFRVDENLELGKKAADFTLKPFDKVFVRSSPSYFTQKEIRIEGEVLFPGEYTLDEQDMRISDLIQQSGGLSQYAYPQGANLTRQVQQNVDASQINLPDSVNVEQQIQESSTKVGIRLKQIMENPGSDQDLILRPGDVLEIPKELQTVQVAGEVLYPISVRFGEKLSFKDYIRSAGGASEMGKPRDAYIVYANGEVDKTGKFLFFRNYPEVRPGATIYIPKKEQKRQLTTQERIGILSAIVSMAAIVSNTIFQIRRN